MAFIPTLNAIKVVLIGSILGQQIVIDVTIGTPAAVGGTDLDDAADAIEDWWTDNGITTTSHDLVFNEIKAYDLSSASAPVVSHAVVLTGLAVYKAVMNNVALVTTFLTANRGRSGRGRNYFPGLPDNGNTEVSPAAGDLVAVNSCWAALPSYLSPLGFDHVVISYQHNGAPRAAGLKQQVTGYRTNGDYDSQRRRLAGRGA